MAARGQRRGARCVPCMAEGPVAPDGCGTVCMRPEGHAGAHRWCRDDEVSVCLTPAGRAALYRSLQAELEVEVARGT
jgi:hypothetical protein